MLQDQTLEQLAVTMANLANDAYNDDCTQVFADLGFNKYQHITNDCANGHLAASADEVVITFRGTNPAHISDLAADGNAFPVEDIGGHVHDGFRTYANYLMPMVMAWVKKYPKRRIYVTGHSLGAAMSLYCVARLEQAGYTVTKLFSFGQPRLGTDHYINQIRADHHRFVNCNDIITHVPPPEMGYHHHGTLCYINYYGNVRKVTGWQRFKDKWRNHYHAWLKGQLFDSLEDHMMGGYIAKLTNIRDTGQKIL
jgi:triacylglycerol lipase